MDRLVVYAPRHIRHGGSGPPLGYTRFLNISSKITSFRLVMRMRYEKIGVVQGTKVTSFGYDIRDFNGDFRISAKVGTR